MHQEAADGEETADDNCSKNPFAQVGGDAKDVRQVAVHFVNKPVMIPGLAGPEPLPARTANKGPDGDHGDPQNNKAEKKRGDFKLALLPRVVARTERVGVNVG